MLANKWLLLLYGLPTEQSAERVSLWRRLKKFGALQLKTSAYVLPDKPLHFERFQWLAKQVRDHGGDATLIRATEIEGVTNDELIRLFNKERSEDYGKLIKELTRFVAQNKKKKKPAEAFPVDLQKFNRRFNEIREADYFECLINPNRLLF
jgi:DNA-binding transcriptional regulator PaaX